MLSKVKNDKTWNRLFFIIVWLCVLSAVLYFILPMYLVRTHNGYLNFLDGEYTEAGYYYSTFKMVAGFNLYHNNDALAPFLGECFAQFCGLILLICTFAKKNRKQLCIIAAVVSAVAVLSTIGWLIGCNAIENNYIKSHTYWLELQYMQSGLDPDMMDEFIEEIFKSELGNSRYCLPSPLVIIHLVLCTVSMFGSIILAISYKIDEMKRKE